MWETKNISAERLEVVLNCVDGIKFNQWELKKLSSLYGNKELITKILSKHKISLANKVIRWDVTREYMMWAIDTYKAILWK